MGAGGGETAQQARRQLASSKRVKAGPRQAEAKRAQLSTQEGGSAGSARGSEGGKGVSERHREVPPQPCTGTATPSLLGSTLDPS